MKTSPPKLFLRFFRWYCHPGLMDHIEGDLVEVYRQRLKKVGKKKADIKFIRDVLLLFRPSIIKPLDGHKNLNNYGMIKSYFKIGWRNLLRNKGYSLINIGGLAMGITVTMLIGLWVYDELSFDKYHKNYDRIVQVMQRQTFNGVVDTEYTIPRPLEFALRNSFSADFEYVSMASWTGDHILLWGEQSISKRGCFFQKDFPEMISLRMLKGTRNALSDPTSILISESTAKSFFGTSEAINQLLRIDSKMDVKVAGVYEDLPFSTSYADLAFIGSWELYITSEKWIKTTVDQWGNNSFQLIAQLARNADINLVSEKIKKVKYKNSKNDQVSNPEIFLHPMKDWHLRSEWKNGQNIGGRIQMVWLFSIIGAFVLILASINFMNLSTARSEKRAKEVGIRLAVGSVRRQLINQFLSESFLVVVLAFIAALALVSLSLPWFNDLAAKKITINWANPSFWLINMAFIFFASLLAGSYPALYLSSFKPITVLKGSFKASQFASMPRKVLVVLQFTVSLTLIIGTIIVYQQIQFSKNRPIGYDRHGLVMIRMKSPEFYGKFELLRGELKANGAIEEMSESSGPITSNRSNHGGLNWEGKDPNLQAEFATVWVTYDYGKTARWQIKEGRDFSREYSTDSSAIILNEAAMRFTGIKNPIGKEIIFEDKSFHVIGVVKDIIMDSPYSPVKQTIYLMDYENVNWINLKLNPSKSVGESISIAESIFRKYIPSAPFDYKFVDQEYSKKFEAEERIGRLSSVFGALAILISCLGLFGLASFVAEQRTKEIGIRKVLGASVANLWRMMSKEFVLLVLISCVVSIPTAYYFLLNWLRSYQYHTEIHWWIPALAGIGALIITMATISFQAIKAASANPVKSLKSE